MWPQPHARAVEVSRALVAEAVIDNQIHSMDSTGFHGVLYKSKSWVHVLVRCVTCFPEAPTDTGAPTETSPPPGLLPVGSLEGREGSTSEQGFVASGIVAGAAIAPRKHFGGASSLVGYLNHLGLGVLYFVRCRVGMKDRRSFVVIQYVPKRLFFGILTIMANSAYGSLTARKRREKKCVG